MSTEIQWMGKPFVRCNKARENCVGICPHFGMHRKETDCDRLVCPHINEYAGCVPEVKSDES